MSDETLKRSNRTAALTYEQHYLTMGKRVMIGMDEVGYGAWAGPMVVTAVSLPLDDPHLTDKLHGVKDSKQMTAHQREAAIDHITQTATAIGMGRAEAHEISTLGAGKGLALAYQRAYDACVSALGVAVEVVLLDGRRTWRTFAPANIAVQRITGGDMASLSIAAASVVAKVTRDHELITLAEKHPAYGFDHHKGYGTTAHRLAIETHGVLRGIHRTNYAPVQRAMQPRLDTHEA